VVNSTVDCGQGTITRTWTATDCAGNTASATQVITVVDTTDPVLVGVPADVTVECSAIPDPAVVTATDNCDQAPVVGLVVNSTVNCGQGTITRTWTATDCAGNTSSATQVITVVDTTDPEITCPPNAQIKYGGSIDPIDTGFATATDNCDPDPAITYSDSVVTDGCGLRTITRTWKATDCAGNFSTCEQTITEKDNVSPTVTCPPDIVIRYYESIDPDNTGWATAYDEWDADPDITYSDSLSVNAEGFDMITRTWTAKDCSRNSASCEQLIILTPNDPARLSIFKLPGTNTMRLTVEGTPGDIWNILTSPDMGDGTWSFMTEIPMLSDVEFYDDTTFSGRKFYKLAEPEALP